METNTNVELAKTFVDAFNRGDFSKSTDLLAEDVTVTGPTGGGVKGRDEVIKAFQDMRIAFPDVVLKIEDILPGESRVAVEYLFTGTNTGELDMGPGFGKVPPTGKTYTDRQVSICTVKGGKITTFTQYIDMFSFLNQLGLIPVPALAPA